MQPPARCLRAAILRIPGQHPAHVTPSWFPRGNSQAPPAPGLPLNISSQLSQPLNHVVRWLCVQRDLTKATTDSVMFQRPRICSLRSSGPLT